MVAEEAVSNQQSALSPRTAWWNKNSLGRRGYDFRFASQCGAEPQCLPDFFSRSPLTCLSPTR
jgi:hypothetical protein